MKYFGTILLMVALCTAQATQTLKNNEIEDQYQAKYYSVRDDIEESMNALLELRSRQIIVAQERISGIDIGVGLKARGPPVTFQGTGRNADGQPHHISREECQRNALQDLQLYLERLRDLYAHGTKLEKTLEYFKISCKPAEGIEQDTCVGRKMTRINYSLDNFKSRVGTLVKEATKASEVSMRKIAECFLDSASLFPTLNGGNAIEGLEKYEYTSLKNNFLDNEIAMPHIVLGVNDIASQQKKRE
ncbi:hypothetical protein KM043_018780 [Ampulex compressa]|nr:hypothetical protein KM043_018780 [Ampulex compressa]